MTHATMQDSVVILKCRQFIASAMSAAFADPRSPTARRAADVHGSALGLAWEVLCEEIARRDDASVGLGERHCHEVDIAPLAQWIGLDLSRRETAHQKIFGLLVSKPCPQYETEYCEWNDTTYRAQKLADIAGFYNAFGVEPSRKNPMRPDHVAMELEFVALLLEKLAYQSQATTADAQLRAEIDSKALHEFIKDHIRWWMPTFGRLIERHVDRLLDCAEAEGADADDLRCFAGVARILSAWVAIERVTNGVEPYRQIVQPSVEEQDTDDSCGACDGCTVS